MIDFHKNKDPLNTGFVYKFKKISAFIALLCLLFSNSIAQDIVQAEYFLNSDPGVGNATQIALTPSPDIQKHSFNVDISGLDNGFHHLYLRSKDDNNVWSITNAYSFYKDIIVAATSEIIKAEYFFNNDPGLGNATDIPVTAGQQIAGITFSADISSLDKGFHNLFIRTKDENGIWSHSNVKTFYIEHIQNVPANIVKAEYFINNDPGVGNAIDIPVTAGQQIAGITFSADISSLDKGFHNLFIRTKDENGIWSHTNVKTFYIEHIQNVPANIVKAEYFINNDPGVGNATDIPVTPGQQIAGITFSADISSLDKGFHNLFIRTKDENGIWSHTNVKTFYIDHYDPVIADIVEAEYFLNSDPGFGNANPIAISAGQNLTNIIAEVDMSALQTEGLNYLYIRTKDSRGNWSHTNVIEFSIDKHITLFAEPLEGGTVSGEGWYEVDYELSVIATSNEGYQFDNWTEEGSIVHNEPTYTFIVTEHRTLTAQFSMIDYQLTLLVNPVGAGTTSGDGLYNMGDEIPIQANPETGWYFVNWTDNNGEEVTLEEGNFIMPAANVTLTANFAEIPTYSLSLIASPSEGGTVSGDGDYEEGASVPVSATANEGYLFINWTDNNGIVSESENFNYTMPAENITLTANFEEVPPPQFTVTLIANPDNIGAVITGGGDYEQSQTVNISASAVDGYNFTGWTGSADDVALLDNESAMSTSFIMPDRNVNLTANYEEIPPELFTLSLIASPVEGGTVSGEGDYEEGTSVPVSATANEGYLFVNWTDNNGIVSESENFNYTMPAENITLTANFEEVPPPQFTVTLIANPDNIGAVLTGNGDYEQAETVNISASAVDGYNFTGWTGSVDDVALLNDEHAMSTSFIMPDRNVTLTANYQEIPPELFTLSLIASPVEGGTVSGEGDYEEGVSVPVSATANEGYLFVNWTDNNGIVSESESFNYTMPAENITLTANFEEVPPPQYTVTLIASPDNIGAVLTGNGDYEQAETVNISASDVLGYNFTGWTGSADDVALLDNESAMSTSFIMPDRNINLTANYQEIPPELFTLSLIASPSEGGTVSGEGDYEEGVSVPVSATANEGYLFVNWTDNNGIVSESESFNYTMPAENITLTANFEEVPPPQFTVTLIANPDNIGAVITGGGDYEQGQTVNISASVVDGYNFTGWTGSADDVALLDDESAMSTSFIMPDRNINLTANYEEIPPELFTLTLIASPVEGGTVSGGGDYEEGETVSISAIANDGFEFAFWKNTNSDIVSESSDFNFIMPAENLTLIAIFDIINNLSELNNINISVYPNPVKDRFFVKSDNAIQKYSLYDINGQLLIEKNNINTTIIEVSTNNLETGIFIIKIHLNDNTVSKRISIMR